MDAMISQAVFYALSALMLLGALFVVLARNPVHAVLCLIFAILNAAGLLVMLGAPFVGMILVIVYGGAVAVLFLFVVMMMDINFHDMRRGVLRYLPLGFGLGGLLLAYMLFAGRLVLDRFSIDAPADVVDNTRALGRVLYTDYALPFEGAGLVLLVATIGAIVLTKRQKLSPRRQNVRAQIGRDRGDVVKLVKVKPGEGAR